MDKLTEILEEYKQLYDEIGRNSQITQSVFVANVGVTAALIGYGLNAGNGTIFLAPFAIIIPSLFFLASQLESTTRIAAYLSVFIEHDSEMLKWESRWLQLRTRGLLPSRRKYTLSLSGLYGLLSLVCILLAFQYWQGNKCWFFAIVTVILLLVAWGILLLVRAFSLQLCEDYIHSWRKLKNESDS